jgi:hypothetical protein
VVDFENTPEETLKRITTGAAAVDLLPLLIQSFFAETLTRD